MRPALSLLRLLPTVGLAAGLAACADPSAPTATYVPARYTPAYMQSWSPRVQNYYQPVPPVPSPPPRYYYVTPRPSPPVDDDEVQRPQPAPRMAEPPQPAPAPTKPWLSWLAPPAEAAAPAPRPAEPEPARGVPPGDECGYWRLCNLPGWRYAY